MSKQNEIEKLRSDIEAVSIHLQEHFNLTKCGAEEALDLLRERVDALGRLAEEPEPDLTPRPGDEGCWVMVWSLSGPERGPLMLAYVDDVDKVQSPFTTGSEMWPHARIVPGPMRGMLQGHDRSGKKPAWLRDRDLLLVDYGYSDPVTARADMADWFTVRRYQKLEVK